MNNGRNFDAIAEAREADAELRREALQTEIDRAWDAGLVTWDGDLLVAEF